MEINFQYKLLNSSYSLDSGNLYWNGSPLMSLNSHYRSVSRMIQSRFLILPTSPHVLTSPQENRVFRAQGLCI